MNRITHQRDDIAFFPQLQESQVAELAAAGFRTLICNRPDSEEGAVASALMADVARRHGLAFVYQPVQFGTITMADGVEFARAVDASPHPVAAYCRSGKRSAAMWVFARAPELGVEPALDLARGAGLDLDELRPRLSSGS